MSLVPLLANLARELDHEYRMSDIDHFLDDDFGLGIHPMELFRRPRSLIAHHPRHRMLPYERSHLHQLLPKRAGRLGRNESSLGLMPNVSKDGFQVCMDVSQFTPNELSVKIVNKTVVVEGKHEEREDDHGMIQRHFVRKYTLPKDYDPNDVISTISSDGVLTLKAPPPPNKASAQNERIVQIQQTGPAHLNIKAPEGSVTDGMKSGANGSSDKMETSK